MPEKISCIMSNFNTEPEQLRQSIECILNQTYKNFELILIDDKSTNGSGGIIEEYARRDARVKPIFNEVNRGLAASLNIGMNAAQGPLIARFDTDDWCRKDRFEIQVKKMNQEHLDVCGAFCFTFGNFRDINAGIFLESDVIGCELFFSSFFIHSTIMMRTGFIRENGLSYSLPMNNAEDFDLWVRLRDANAKMAVIRTPLIGYRIHKQSVSFVHKDNQRSCAELICRRQLEKLTEVSPEEWKCHKVLCGFSEFVPGQIAEIGSWCEKLISVNDKIKKFEPSAFHKVVWNRMLKQVLKARISILEKIKICMLTPGLFNLTNLQWLAVMLCSKKLCRWKLRKTYRKII